VNSAPSRPRPDAPRPKGIFICNADSYDAVYAPPEREQIRALAEIVFPSHATADQLRKDPSILRDVQMIFASWGSPSFDETILPSAPNLELVFYAAGSIKNVVSDAFWDRGVRITSAYGANAVPVAEYALAMTILSLKNAFFYSGESRRQHRAVRKPARPITGVYGATVGLISLGQVARKFVELLRPFELRVIAYDPFVKAEQARQHGVERLCTLEEIFEQSDVVSLHAPWLKETEGMIRGEHIARMKQRATFLNTARGALVREDELIDVLRRRPDLTAILDVTYPEPPPDGSPLFTLPNVLYTPHIAGSSGAERRRLAQYMIDELKRYLAGEPLRWEIDREKLKVLA
jgi:phosphoglycerate dehydrogenase-like enzyme